jgi:putative membrane-bound dehydrogenase-like protein
VLRTLLSAAFLILGSSARADDQPVSADPRLVVELFAAAPNIVHPIAMDFDSKGRLLVIESHTHFPPTKYAGPKHDRIRMIEDTDGDGNADRFTTFYEGTDKTMDLAVHFDGSVYVAARNEIIRLRDTNGDGKADERTRIVFLDTAGNYPHNGLSGLAFNSKGELYFGMGENLGASYTLTGADGATIADTEGGKVFHCTADGKNLRRVATGFWNPFGACFDIYGRLFVVDNDPDSSPPCRLVHVVEGGDYGFQFRYGRAGRHVFQAWNGELPGTLPFVCGTGESPCEVIAYESDGLPDEYRGSLLVPAWADHRVERYVLKSRGASFGADRKPFINGGKEFRPSGMSVAPDGSVFISDWVSRSYELHGKGAIWHVRQKDSKPRPRPKDPRTAILSADRKTREAAARELAKSEDGRQDLLSLVSSQSARIRATAATALIDEENPKLDILEIAQNDKDIGFRDLAVRALAIRRATILEFADEKQPPLLQAAAAAGLNVDKGADELQRMLGDPDPFLRHAAIQKLWWIELRDLKKFEGIRKTGAVLAMRRNNPIARRYESLPILDDSDPDVRFLAIKWVSDEKLTQYRPRIVEMLKSPRLDPREFMALTTALARLDDKPVNDDGLAEYFIAKIADKTAPLPTRLMALRSVNVLYSKFKTEMLTALLDIDDAAFRVEVLRALKDRGDAKAAGFASAIAMNPKQSSFVRAQAILTYASLTSSDTGFLKELAGDANEAIAAEAKRALPNRIIEKTQRPAATDTDAWLKRLEGPFDADAGRRIFENAKLTNCSSCHRVDGRGSNVGPDLSLIGRTDRKWIVESILQPSAVVAPHYQTWKVETADGKVITGLLVHTNLDESYYLNERGQRVKVLATDVADAAPIRTSIMPDGLHDKLTDQEIRDLMGYLSTRK